MSIMHLLLLLLYQRMYTSLCSSHNCNSHLLVHVLLRLKDVVLLDQIDRGVLVGVVLLVLWIVSFCGLVLFVVCCFSFLYFVHEFEYMVDIQNDVVHCWVVVVYLKERISQHETCAMYKCKVHTR